MSGTGKSIALEAARTGFRAVDTDEGDWTEWSEIEGGSVWREERIAELLAGEEGLSPAPGTVSNQGRFDERFDAVVRRVLGERSHRPHRSRSTTRWEDRRAAGACAPRPGRGRAAYVGRALTKSMPLSRSKTSSTNSRSWSRPFRLDRKPPASHALTRLPLRRRRRTQRPTSASAGRLPEAAAWTCHSRADQMPPSS